MGAEVTRCSGAMFLMQSGASATMLLSAALWLCKVLERKRVRVSPRQGLAKMHVFR